MKQIKYFLFFIFALNFNLFADGSAGTKSMEFLNIGMGARAIGMGEAYTAVSDDAIGILWNPAGVADLEKEEVSFTYNQYIEDIQQGFISFASPQYKYGGLGCSLLYLKTSDIAEYDKYDNPNGTFGTYSMAYILTYTKKINDFGFGANLKFLEEKLYKEKYTGEALDLGAKYKINDYFAVGAALLNISDGVRYHSMTEDLALTQKIGMSCNLGSTIVATDLIKDDVKTHVAFGIEHNLMDMLYLRCGYKTSEDLAEGFRGGFGIKIKNLVFDYGFTKYQDFGWMHQFTLKITTDKIRQRMKGLDEKYSPEQKDFFKNIELLNTQISEKNKETVLYRKSMDYVMMNEKERNMFDNHKLALEKMQNAIKEFAKENEMLIKNMKESDLEG